MKNELYGVITETMKGMQNPEEIKILRELVEDIMGKSIDYAEKKYNEIEKNLHFSIIGKKVDYSIFNTVVEKRYINTYNDFFYPIYDEDFVEEQDLKKLYEEFIENGRAVVSRGMLQAEYSVIKMITDSNRVFNGVVITEKEEINISVKIEYDTKYEKIEEEVYNLFNQNTIEWSTLNIPYCKKIVSIVMTDFSGDIEKLKNVQKIKFDLAEYKETYFQDYFPVWNIKRYGITPARGAMPTKERINYEYILKYGDRKNLNGFAFDVKGGLIIDVILNEHEFKVVSNSKELDNWVVYEFKEVNSDSGMVSFNFPIESNTKNMNFIENIKRKSLRTKAELRRVIDSYQSIKKELLYIDAEIAAEINEKTDGYLLNKFIQDDFFTKNHKELLILKFKQVKDSFMIEDMLSFITAEIQILYPEYECRSILND